MAMQNPDLKAQNKPKARNINQNGGLKHRSGGRKLPNIAKLEAEGQNQCTLQA